MSRPRIICHMHTLLNGKVDGIANPTSVGMRSQQLYFDLFLGENRFFGNHRGWLSGRGTSEAIMGGELPQAELPEPEAPVPEGDFLAMPDAQFNYFAVDSAGVIAWDRSTFDYFGVQVHIVELIPANASAAFKAHLRAQGVSYILAGEDRLDLATAVERIGELFGTDELILGGGPTLNWSMVRDGLCDEISLVLMPTADAESHTRSLFEAHEKHSRAEPIAFSLKAVEPLEDGSVWLRYDVRGPVADAEPRPA
ncbi:dihydrofolate reductase family protein [Brevibacterium salitolerans]|uniref:RibD family protein n=2 Tax=Brevibacterium TaxID=1696 RepID=A0ABN2WFD6_9MICO